MRVDTSDKKCLIAKVRPQRMGFKVNEMIKAQARGRVYNPNRMGSVEVTVFAENRKDLDSVMVRNMILTEARKHAPHVGFVYTRNTVVTRGGWERIFEIT